MTQQIISVNRIMLWKSFFYLLYNYPMNTDLTKLSFGFTDADMDVLHRLKKRLESSQGIMSNIAIIRQAIRIMLMELGD